MAGPAEGGYFSSMHRALALALLVAAIAVPVSLALPGGSEVHVTMRGFCNTSNRLDSNAVLLSTTIECKTSRTCYCNGSKLRYSFSNHWKSPGNGGSGRELAVLVVSGKVATLTFALNGKKEGTGESAGTWRLAKVVGAPKTNYVQTGTYSTVATPIGSDLTPSFGTHITATLSCWACQAGNG